MAWYEPGLTFPSSHTCHISKQCDILYAIRTWPLAEPNPISLTSVPSDSNGQDIVICLTKSVFARALKL